jgi:tRNA(Ile2)-agmatinylcytidine synthase
MPLISISFDDVDSRFWGCTTHLAGLFLVEASRLPGVEPADYPLLVRLNPAVPWKTRGNAAVTLRLRVRGDDQAASLCEAAVSMVEEYSSPRIGEPVKRPGLACLEGEPWREPVLRTVYRRALVDVVTPDIADRAARKTGARLWGGRGRIGALAALAALAPGDPYTFELTAYRHPDLWGTPRCILHSEAPRVEARLPPCTFNNYDPVSGRVTAAPGGPDPVLAGFRGTCPERLAEYATLLCEQPHFWVLYRSNQHTDAHARPITAPRPYQAGFIAGAVAGAPLVTPGGHVIVRVEADNIVIDAAFFRETGPLNRAARVLRRGDRVWLLGSVRPYAPRGVPVIAAEKMVVLQLSTAYRDVSPRCPRCGHRMKRLGRAGGYRCPRCGYTDRSARPVRIPIPRRLGPGVYTPGAGRLRHLTKPWPEPPAPERISIPRTLSWREILSANANPPVSDPPVSSGSHHSSW